MRNPSPTRVLIRHFFRRFFDNDTVEADGDTTTTMVRALAAIAAPSLMFAFFLQTQYPGRPLWAAVQDQLFFPVFALVAIGVVTTFTGEMMFPDRIDFLVLTPLPLGRLQLLRSKAAALVLFLSLFLAGSEGFGLLLYPAIAHVQFLRQTMSHLMSASLAGLFGALVVLSINGVLLTLLDARRFRLVSPAVQMLLIAAFLLLLFAYARYGDDTAALLQEPLNVARYLPPLWFLAVYDRLLYGAAAPAFAGVLLPYAERTTLLLTGVVLLTYPLAWERTRRRVLEGASPRPVRPLRWPALIARGLVPSPYGRALFSFVGQTIRRNAKYQTFLALYGGTGLALAIACAAVPTTHGLEISGQGLRAILPLLMFWTVAGLRTAFGFPLELQAAWVFRVTGADTGACTAAARVWVRLAAAALLALVLLLQVLAGFSARQLLVQFVVGLCLASMLTDAFFFERFLPFTRPRMPGRANFPLLLTLYLGALPPFVFGVLALDRALEQKLPRAFFALLLAAFVHVLVRRAHRNPMEVEEQMEGYEGEFQRLGLG